MALEVVLGAGDEVLTPSAVVTRVTRLAALVSTPAGAGFGTGGASGLMVDATNRSAPAIPKMGNKSFTTEWRNLSGRLPACQAIVRP